MNKPNHVWVIDDDYSIRWVLQRALTQAEMQVTSFENGNTIEVQLQGEIPDAIITDIRMPGIDGLALLKRIREQHPSLPVIVMTAHSDLDSAVAAYEGGAFEYLPKPFDVDEAVALVERAVEHARQSGATSATTEEVETTEIIGEAPAMQEVFRAIGRLTRSNITVLINGQSGTGKELVAQALHRHSPRADKPFIALNMAAIPRDLLESELFGHEKGAFTGAQGSRSGRFEQADGGTLFLDEIGDMPAELQTRLLRVIAEGEFFRVGGHTPIKVDVRIIAATHQDLEQRVREGHFREDLFHRLNVIRIHIPSLRDRREDIPQLASYFLGRAAKELDVEVKVLRPEVERYLSQIDWPGNVRQLENSCRWLTVMGSGREIHMEDLPPELRHDTSSPENSNDWVAELQRWAERHLAAGDSNLLDIAVPALERTLLEAALKETGGRRQDAAKRLGWGRNTLTRKLKELNIEGGEEEN